MCRYRAPFLFAHPRSLLFIHTTSMPLASKTQTPPATHFSHPAPNTLHHSMSDTHASGKATARSRFISVVNTATGHSPISTQRVPVPVYSTHKPREPQGVLIVLSSEDDDEDTETPGNEYLQSYLYRLLTQRCQRCQWPFVLANLELFPSALTLPVLQLRLESLSPNKMSARMGREVAIGPLLSSLSSSDASESLVGPCLVLS